MVNTAGLKTNLKKLMQKAVTDEMKSDDFAEQLCDYLETWLKSATVTVASGIAVSTTGTAAAQTGITTAQGTGGIS